MPETIIETRTFDIFTWEELDDCAKEAVRGSEWVQWFANEDLQEMWTTGKGTKRTPDDLVDQATEWLTSYPLALGYTVTSVEWDVYPGCWVNTEGSIDVEKFVEKQGLAFPQLQAERQWEGQSTFTLIGRMVAYNSNPYQMGAFAIEGLPYEHDARRYEPDIDWEGIRDEMDELHDCITRWHTQFDRDCGDKLQEDYDWLYSDENIAELAEANDMRFLKDGTRYWR